MKASIIVEQVNEKQMNSNSNHEIYSYRILNSAVEIVYEAFDNPLYLKNWWGPNGFTNSIHEFDLKPGGKWILTMYGPEKGKYENSAVFKIVNPLKLITWKRISKPLFDMEIGFEKISISKSKISFRMIFDKAEECEKIRSFVEPKNKENFDRLEKEIFNISSNLK